jgi:O-acetylhomoserine/O-acetylserine sulfhydrylase-like pyridoxal-dependent enzyme
MAGKLPNSCATTPGLNGSITPDSHPVQYYALAQKYLGGRACSLMTVGLKGGFEAAVKFHDALQLVTRLVNLG